MSKQERRTEEARRQQVAQMRRQQLRGERRRRLALMGAVAVVALALVAGIAVAVVRQRQGTSLAGVKKYTETSKHVATTVTYPQTPPAGGDHDAVWLNCGIYDQPVRNENAVHDLEHGAVWITYRPSLRKGDIETLKKIARKTTYITLSPYPSLPAPVVASAWGVQLRLPGAHDKRLPTFIAKYRQGPTAPEPGSPCTGGTGTPSK